MFYRDRRRTGKKLLLLPIIYIYRIKVIWNKLCMFMDAYHKCMTTIIVMRKDILRQNRLHFVNPLLSSLEYFIYMLFILLVIEERIK